MTENASVDCYLFISFIAYFFCEKLFMLREQAFTGIVTY